MKNTPTPYENDEERKSISDAVVEFESKMKI